ncbi:endo-1,4-beta-xylanase A [Xanthomonas vesicatoria ATCC 35937]|uniref:Endo-1,4-beta-xylanase A n=1 Tax=Xanthomonas vesicatoria ATCC 35937 TaxID=925775 RepID=F0BDW4_9XANT|nr:endo-1,4-beta-xylanase A [Xanthomonas vesicatoria ATCC 35937]
MVVGAIALPAFARCDTAGTSLKHAYADAFLLGTAVNAEIVSGKDAAAAALVACHFNAVTPENVMKAEVVSGSSWMPRARPTPRPRRSSACARISQASRGAMSARCRPGMW